jgi:hypothetical protein
VGFERDCRLLRRVRLAAGLALCAALAAPAGAKEKERIAESETPPPGQEAVPVPLGPRSGVRVYGEEFINVLADFGPGEAAHGMRRGLEIENLGWKGAAGSSVLQTSAMETFFLQQAELLSQEKQLELAFLESAGRPIAFAYGQAAKGVFHSAKIGYDPAFAEYSPGQLLRYFLLERFFHESGRTALDFLGPLTASHAAWHPQTYAVARLAASLGRATGKIAVAAYAHWR